MQTINVTGFVLSPMTTDLIFYQGHKATSINYQISLLKSAILEWSALYFSQVQW